MDGLGLRHVTTLGLDRDRREFKVLPLGKLAADPQFRERFDREARTILPADTSPRLHAV
jgi:hypothetical protein